MIGETFAGSYQIVRQLGEGGMGVVYEAHHLPTGRRAAIKVITGQLAQDPRLVERFQVEIKAASAIDSEHVVEVFDSGYDAARRAPFLAMELLVGTDLQTLIERVGPLSPDLALRIGAQACLGLERAHARGIVHRDIKPANIFLAERAGGERRVKILDFGIAKLKMDDSALAAKPKLTRTGTLMGSPIYMSPEQARNQSMLDHRSDLWSLGVVLYEALTGRAPLADLEELGEILVTLCSQPVPPLRSRLPWLDPAIAGAIERALVIDPAYRYGSAREMGMALAAFLPQGVLIHESMLVPFHPGPAPATTGVAQPFHSTVPSQPLAFPQAGFSQPPTLPRPAAAPGRGAVIAAALGVAAIAGGLGGAWALGWIGGASPPASPTIALPEPAAVATLQPALGVSLPASLVALKGVWRSESGRVYDAVVSEEGLEFQIRDPAQFAGQAYVEHEARFILRAPPGGAGAFLVEDRIRPVPPQGTAYDAARARATCVQPWSAIGGKPLEATLRGERLVVKMARVEVPSGMFQQEGTHVVGCSALAGAKASEVESALLKQ